METSYPGDFAFYRLSKFRTWYVESTKTRRVTVDFSIFPNVKNEAPLLSFFIPGLLFSAKQQC